jgi:hypothetical protein
MALDIPPSSVRKLDMSSFTGDTWAVEATLAVSGATVPRFIATGGPVRWVAQGMSSGAIGATAAVDTTAVLSTCLIKIGRTTGGVAFARKLVSVTGLLANREITEEDVSPGDVFVLAIPSAVAGTAAFLWLMPTAGCIERGSVTP